MAIIRRVPGAVGVRPARTFTAASSQSVRGAEAIAATLTGTVTAAGWFRPNAGTGGKTLWSVGDTAGDNNYYRLAYDEGAGALDAEARGTSGTNSQATVSGITEDVWHHAAGVWTPSVSMLVYIDGALGDTRGLLNPPTGLDEMAFGVLRRSGFAQYMDGALACWGLWREALSGEEIAALARGTHPTTIRPTGLIDAWELDSVGPAVGVVRGTVLTAYGGGGLLPRPAHLQGPPRRQRRYIDLAASGGGGTTYTLTAETGEVAVTGQSGTLKRIATVVANAGTVALTGTSAALRRAYAVMANAASVVLTGTTATLTRTFRISAQPGTVELTGSSANLTVPGTGPDPEARKKQFLMLGVMKAWWLVLLITGCGS
jgi:hypothetical protein